MKRQIIFIIFVIGLILTVNTANTNIKELIPTEKNYFYYSIDGIVNKENFLHKDDNRANSEIYYRNKWLKIWQDSLETSGLNYFGPINITISDSLASQLFNLKVNNYIINFNDSRIIFVDKIKGFYVRVSDDLWPEYHIKTDKNRNCRGFNIITDSMNSANLLSDEIDVDTLNLDSELYENKIASYFLKNRDNLKKQLRYDTIIDFDKSDEELENKIRELFSYQYLKINLNNDNENNFIIIGTNNDYKYHTFVAAVLEGKKGIIIKLHSHFKQVIRIKDDYFLLLHHYTPYTGGSVYSFYRVYDNDLKRIWNDGSYSR